MAEDTSTGGTATADAPAGHVDPALVVDPGKPAIDASASPDAAAKPDAAASAAAKTDDATAHVETPEEKETRERDEAGRFKAKEIDYSTVVLPKDSPLNPAVLEKTVAIARAQGFSAEQAQATVDLLNEQIGASRTALLDAHKPGGAEWTKMLDGWKAQTLADPALGKTPEERKLAIQRGTQVLNKYKEANPADADAMVAFLNDSGLGEHPAAVRFFSWLGKSAGERPLASPNGDGAPAKSLVDIFYPKGPNRTAAEIAADP